MQVRAEYPPYYWAAFVLAGDAGEVTGKISQATPTVTPMATVENSVDVNS